MVNATSGTQATDPFSFISPTNAPSSSLDSFAQQLSTELESYLTKLASGAHVEIDVQSGQGQSSGSSQFTVTVRDLGASSTTPVSTGASGSTPAATTPASTSDAVKQPVDKSHMTPTDAYWAEQPAAVQQLRNCPDDQKFSMAEDLAKQGYAVDLPIMVWGWDPLVTMTLRQNDGYTWVPSAFQPNIPIGPGIANVWNLPGYDAKNPPPGSIKVSTDFAQGSNGQDPWMKTISETSA
jgi:hypothetical protein